MITFEIEIKNGAIINIDGCNETKSLAKKWGDKIPTNWPTKETDCHLALKKAINENISLDNWNRSIVTDGYMYSVTNNQTPATKNYLMEVGEKMDQIYNKFNLLLEVPKVLPDGIYRIA